MQPRSLLQFAFGTALLAVASVAVRAIRPVAANTWPSHSIHFALALLIATLLEWGVRRRRGTSSGIWIRGNPLLGWFLMNLAIWVAVVGVVLLAGLPVVRSGVSLGVYLTVQYLAASALVGVFATITSKGAE